jgi:hypothetical protein
MVDPEKHKNFLAHIFGTLEGLEKELLAYKATFVAIKALLLMHDISEDVDAALDSARNSESVQNPVKEKYGKGLETLLRAVFRSSPLRISSVMASQRCSKLVLVEPPIPDEPLIAGSGVDRCSGEYKWDDALDPVIVRSVGDVAER